MPAALATCSEALKRRICAIDAVSRLARAGILSPSADGNTEAVSGVGIRRLRPPYRSSGIGSAAARSPQPRRAGPFARPLLVQEELLPVESARARATAPGPRRVLLSDATVRHGDLNKGPLGDVLFEDDRVAVVLGLRCDRGRTGKPVALSSGNEPNSVDDLRLFRLAMARLLDAFPAVVGHQVQGLSDGRCGPFAHPGAAFPPRESELPIRREPASMPRPGCASEPPGPRKSSYTCCVNVLCSQS